MSTKLTIALTAAVTIPLTVIQLKLLPVDQPTPEASTPQASILTPKESKTTTKLTTSQKTGPLPEDKPATNSLTEFKYDLQHSPETAFAKLAEINLNKHHPDLLAQVYLEHFQQTGDLAKGLEGIDHFSEHHSLNASLIPTYLGALAKEDPTEALNWCLENTDVTGTNQALKQIASNTDYQIDLTPTLQQVLDSDAHEEHKTIYLAEAFGKWIDQSPIKAMEYFADFPSSEMMDEITLQNIEKIAALDPTTAQDWIQFLTHEEERIYALELLESTR